MVMSVLAGAKCNMPIFLQIDIKLRDSKSRDQYFGQFCSTLEAFSDNFQANTDNYGFVSIFTTEEQPLKRTRRAAAVVNLFYSSHFIALLD